MRTQTISSVQPQLQVAEELVPLHQLAALFRKNHWGYRCAGKGVPIDKPVKKGKWTYTPSSLDCPKLHPQARARGVEIENNLIPVRQWIYGENDDQVAKPEARPTQPMLPIQPVTPKREWDIDWEEIVGGALSVTFLLVSGMLALLTTTASTYRPRNPEPIVYESRQPGITSALWCGDPVLYCMLADEEYTIHGKSTIVQVFRWFKD